MAGRILIDGYFLQKPYGFGRFIHELCRSIGSHDSEHEFIVATSSRVDVQSLPSYRNITWHSLPEQNFVLWEQFAIPRLARHLSCSVIHFPYNTRAVVTGNIPTVTTVHDVIFLDDAVPLSKVKPWIVSQYSKGVFKLATGKSDAVVSVSDTTRQALGRLGVKATTVYNTVDGFLALLPEAPVNSEQRYILHRGGYAAHRNTERIIHAFRKVRGKIPDVELWIVGAPKGADVWGVHADEAVRFLPRLSDADMARTYAASTCVIAASLLEGFGLPIIEGFGFGAPVITSNLDPMQEVAGGAALLVDPQDVDALENAMVSIISNTELAGSLVEKGRRRIQDFASKRVAEQMNLVYQTCIER
jgi:glycosyltransferase involved in cell wall biosynthesis